MKIGLIVLAIVLIAGLAFSIWVARGIYQFMLAVLHDVNEHRAEVKRQMIIFGRYKQ